MSNIRGALTKQLDRIMPIEGASAATYGILSGVWISGGGFVGAETLGWVERSSQHIVDPVTALGATATALATGVSVALWDRSNRVQDYQRPDTNF